MSKENKSFVVRMRCIVTKDVIVENCTRKEAEKDPWDHAVDEIEIDQDDWEVISVKENQ